MEIRNGRRNGVDRRAEGERKTHERAVNIEARQLIATAIDAVDARGIHDQRHQAVGDLEDDLAAFLGNHRQVTNELDAVAKPLLRVQQDGLPDQRFAAPLWLLPAHSLWQGALAVILGILAVLFVIVGASMVRKQPKTEKASEN